MVPHSPLLLLNALQVVLGIAGIVFLIRAHELKTYWPLLVMSLWQAPPYFLLLYLRSLGPAHISRKLAYILYFYTFWPLFALSALASLVLTYTIFDSAMTPLKGLRNLGQIMYRWAAAISLAIALSVAIAPAAPAANQIVLAVEQLQRTSAILIVSLMMFVVFAIRPMGLSIRSRVFGASVGTLIISITDLLQAGYLARYRSLYSTYSIVQSLVACFAGCIWIYYFAVPEPKRKFILLPTTSPFHRWNQISELLGHDPGYVAIGGVPPEAFAAAEIEIFHRASAKMNALSEGGSNGLTSGGTTSSAQPQAADNKLDKQ